MTKAMAQEILFIEVVTPAIANRSRTFKAVPAGTNSTVEVTVEVNKEIRDLLETANSSPYGDVFVSFRMEGKRGSRDVFSLTQIRLVDDYSAKIVFSETVKHAA